MQFITVGETTFHVVHRPGPSDRPVVAFINALGCDLRIWDAVAPAIGADFPVLLFDKRGHGLSDLGVQPATIADHAADLAGLLDRIGAREVILCGLSVGGLVAQAFAEAHPERLCALLLCGTAPRIGSVEIWSERIAAVKRDGIAALADGTLERWFTPAFHATEPALLAGCRNMLVRQPVAGYVGCCAAIRDADLTAAAGRIAVPTLVVVGDQDGSTPPDVVQATAALIPGARFEIIADAAHIACVEQPAALIALARDFLAENGFLPPGGG